MGRNNMSRKEREQNQPDNAVLSATRPKSVVRNRIAITGVVLVGFLGLVGCMQSEEPQDTTSPESSEATGTFLITGGATAVMNCAFWQGAGQDAIMLVKDASGSIIGPDYKATFDQVQGGKTKVVVRNGNGESDANLSAKMKRWLRGCPDSTQVELPGSAGRL
ncbi:MAG: hypothetical protein WCD16_00165 [Paracoccaceae bacterium]